MREGVSSGSGDAAISVELSCRGTTRPFVALEKSARSTTTAVETRQSCYFAFCRQKSRLRTCYAGSAHYIAKIMAREEQAFRSRTAILLPMLRFQIQYLRDIMIHANLVCQEPARVSSRLACPRCTGFQQLFLLEEEEADLAYSRSRLCHLHVLILSSLLFESFAFFSSLIQISTTTASLVQLYTSAKMQLRKVLRLQTARTDPFSFLVS